MHPQAANDGARSEFRTTVVVMTMKEKKRAMYSILPPLRQFIRDRELNLCRNVRHPLLLRQDRSQIRTRWTRIEKCDVVTVKQGRKMGELGNGKWEMGKEPSSVKTVGNK
jgi:hypothetical protein